MNEKINEEVQKAPGLANTHFAMLIIFALLLIHSINQIQLYMSNNINSEILLAH